MTNKSLSEQICEVCGIEPKYWCSYHSCICPIQNIGKFNPKYPKQVVTKECETRSKERRYPNFENNNNNFVKLLNLDFSPRFKSLLHYITSIFCSTNSTKDLLVQILHELKFNSQSDTVKQIKQAIRQADWEY